MVGEVSNILLWNGVSFRFKRLEKSYNSVNFLSLHCQLTRHASLEFFLRRRALYEHRHFHNIACSSTVSGLNCGPPTFIPVWQYAGSPPGWWFLFVGEKPKTQTRSEESRICVVASFTRRNQNAAHTTETSEVSADGSQVCQSGSQIQT